MPQPKALALSILPPLALNTFLGALLFSSHTYFCYLLSYLPIFAPRPTKSTNSIGGIAIPHKADHLEWTSFGAEDTIMFMESLHKLPHPTLLSFIAGMGAGVIQGVAFTPVENAVK